MPADRNLDHLYPKFREKVKSILEHLRAYASKHMPKGTKWLVVQGLRSAKYQNQLYRQGRTAPGKVVTNCDGYVKKSNHQSGLAVDLMAYAGSSSVGTKRDYAYLGHLARAHGLKWGGDSKTFYDGDHIEWDPKDKGVYGEALAWLEAQGLAK